VAGIYTPEEVADFQRPREVIDVTPQDVLGARDEPMVAVTTPHEQNAAERPQTPRMGREEPGSMEYFSSLDLTVSQRAAIADMCDDYLTDNQIRKPAGKPSVAYVPRKVIEEYIYILTGRQTEGEAE